MIIDCLQRSHHRFPRTFTSTGDGDKIIWALIIVLTIGFFALGAIVYFIVVVNSSASRRHRPPRSRQDAGPYQHRPPPDPYAHQPPHYYGPQHYGPQHYGQGHYSDETDDAADALRDMDRR